jgi:hypothetical protein
MSELTVVFGVLALCAVIVLAIGGVLIAVAGKELEREDTDEQPRKKGPMEW